MFTNLQMAAAILFGIVLGIGLRHAMAALSPACWWEHKWVYYSEGSSSETFLGTTIMVQRLPTIRRCSACDRTDRRDCCGVFRMMTGDEYAAFLKARENSSLREYKGKLPDKYIIN